MWIALPLQKDTNYTSYNDWTQFQEFKNLVSEILQFYATTHFSENGKYFNAVWTFIISDLLSYTHNYIIVIL